MVLKTKTRTENKMKTFQVGKNYTTRSACDHDCIFSFEVTARTAKTITIKSNFGEKRCKIAIQGDEEYALPLGRYSMAPVIRAN